MWLTTQFNIDVDVEKQDIAQYFKHIHVLSFKAK